MNEQYTRAPHRRSQTQSGPSPKAALLIDFDNVTMAMRSNLGQELRNFLNSDIVRGQVSVQRAYADWRRYPQYIVPLSEASIDLIFAPAYGSSKKNATDIRLAIDALELVFTRPEIGTYILLSGDSDFSSLVLKLKEYGKYVIGVGLQESSSDLLVQNCDEYYSYNSLSGLTSADELTTQSHDPWELVEAAVQRMEERDDVMRSDRLKQVMLELDATFDEKDHGFNKFNRFLAEASSRGLIRLRKIGDGHYEVSPSRAKRPEPVGPAAGDGGGPGGGSAREEARSGGGSSGERSGDGGRGRPSAGREERAVPEGGGEAPAQIPTDALRRAYDLLRDVVDDLADEDGSVRDSEVKREMLRRDEDFDEAALGFSKFSRFLRQAYDEGVVELTTDPDGNYHLQPAGAEPITFDDPEEEARQEAPGEEEPRSREETEETAGPAPEAPEAAEPTGGDEGTAADATAGGRRARGRGRGGLGRFRSGSRRGGPAPEEESDVADLSLGPVDGEGGEEPGDRRDDDAGRAGTDDGARAAARRGRGGLGRFRRGRTAVDRDADDAGDGEPTPGPVDEGGGQPESAAPASGEDRSREDVGPRTSGGAARRPGAAGGGLPVPSEASDDPVGYMVGNYPGVGRKTAEKLVEAFGDDLFAVIDREPHRLNDVLPAHRAEAVVEARKAEVERASA